MSSGNHGRHAKSQRAPKPAYPSKVELSVSPIAPSDQPDKAYAKVFEELLAIPQYQLQPVILNPWTVEGWVLAIIRNVEPLRSELAKLYDFDITILDKLRDYAHALDWADLQYRFASDPIEINAHVKEAKRLRDTFLSDIRGLIAHGLIAPSLLEKVNRMHGAANVANTLLILTTMLFEHWPAIEGRCPLTRQALVAAEQLAGDLNASIGRIKFGTIEKKNAVEMRVRAYTKVMLTYDELRRAVVYLRWKHKDADKIAPSLFRTRKRRQRKKASKHAELAPSAEMSSARDHAPETVSAPNAEDKAR